MYFYTIVNGVWTQVQHLEILATSPGDFAGESVSISGDIAVASAPSRDLVAGTLVDAGAVFVFRRNSALPLEQQWEYQTMLTASDPQAGAQFGGLSITTFSNNSQGVALDGNLLVVGALGATVSGQSGAGKAYVFLYNPATQTWTQEAILTPTPPPTGSYQSQPGANFGTSVAISGSTVIVGSPSIITAARAMRAWPTCSPAAPARRTHGPKLRP